MTPGDPRCFWGDPEMTLGDPRLTQCDPGVFPGNPWVTLCDPQVNLGNPLVTQGNPWVPGPFGLAWWFGTGLTSSRWPPGGWGLVRSKSSVVGAWPGLLGTDQVQAAGLARFRWQA